MVGAVFSAAMPLTLISAHADPEQPRIGKVLAVTGKVWVTRALPAVRKTPLKLNDEIFDGDIFITAPKSSLKVLLGQKEAALFIKEDSTVKIVHSDGKNWLLDLKQGMVLSNVKPKPKTKEFFRVKTGAAVMGVRGTVFFVKEEPGKDVFLCTCIGSISVDDQITFVSKHHDIPKFIRSGEDALSKRMTDSDMGHDHADSEAIELGKYLE